MTPVVLLHGLGGSPEIWNQVLADLGDLDGVSAPALAATGSITADAAALEDHLPREGKAILAGHSMGGLVATALAERAPDRVAELILINTTPTRESRISANSLTERMLNLPVVGRILWASATPNRLRAGLRTAVAPGVDVPPVLVEALGDTSYDAFVGSSKAMDAYLTERPLSRRLSDLSQPVTFLYGTEDQRVEPSAFRALEQVPGVELLPIEGVGHTPPLERPSVVASVLSHR